MTSSSTRSINKPAVAGVSLWVGVVVLISRWMGDQAHHWLPVQASTAAPLVDNLFSFETAIGTFVFIGVVSVMVWVVLFNRAEKYDETDAIPLEGNTRLEVIMDRDSLRVGHGHRLSGRSGPPPSWGCSDRWSTSTPVIRRRRSVAIRAIACRPNRWR